MTCTPPRLYIAALSLAACSAGWAQSGMPTEAQLQQWDARFIPGLYEVNEYSVNADLQPIPKTMKRTQACFGTADEMANVSRLPLLAAALWQQCEVMKVRLEPPKFAVTMKCEPATPKGPPVAGMVALGQIGDNEFQSRLMQQEMGAQAKILYGVGSTFRRVADCGK